MKSFPIPRKKQNDSQVENHWLIHALQMPHLNSRNKSNSNRITEYLVLDEGWLNFSFILR